MGKSIIWFYFEKKGDSSKCNKCNKVIVNRGNTTNLRYHLKSKHPFDFAEMEKQSKLNRSDTDIDASELLADDPDSDDVAAHATSFSDYTSDSLSLSSSQISNKLPSCSKQMKMENFTISKQSQEKMDKAVTYFIVTEFQPYDTVEKKGFKKGVHTLNPGYKLPSRKVLTTSKVPSLYRSTRDIISNNLKNIKYISFTTDCWTSTAQQPFIALTAHYVTSSFEIQSACLGCNVLAEDHTGENIADALLSLMLEWDVSDKSIAMTTDYGANVVLAISNLNKLHIPCFGHTMNTAINRALSINEISESINKIKQIQAVFAHSWKITRELHDIQDKLMLPRKNIPSYTKTRWWSLLTLMNTVIEQELALMTLFQTYGKGQYKKLILNGQEMEILKEIANILNPLENISSHLSGEKYVTASLILPIFAKLKTDFIDTADETQIDTELIDIKKTFLYTIYSLLKERYITTEDVLKKDRVCDTHHTLLKCTFLDPRFKMSSFNDQIKELAKQLIADEANAVETDFNVVSNSSTNKKKSGLSSILESIFKTSSTNNTCENEITTYLTYPGINIDDDPLEWWKANSSVFPRLSHLAKKFLAIPATSVPSERVFSHGGLVVTDTRSSLTGEHVEELVFLAMNKEYIQ